MMAQNTELSHFHIFFDSHTAKSAVELYQWSSGFLLHCAEIWTDVRKIGWNPSDDPWQESSKKISHQSRLFSEEFTAVWHLFEFLWSYFTAASVSVVICIKPAFAFWYLFPRCPVLCSCLSRLVFSCPCCQVFCIQVAITVSCFTLKVCFLLCPALDLPPFCVCFSFCLLHEFL